MSGKDPVANYAMPWIESRHSAAALDEGQLSISPAKIYLAVISPLPRDRYARIPDVGHSTFPSGTPPFCPIEAVVRSQSALGVSP